MKKTIAFAAAFLLVGGAGFAASANDQIIADLTGKGFQRIEIDNGVNQIKVEAIRGSEKLELVYDRNTGALLKQEMEQVRAGEDTAPGVSIRDRARDFVEGARAGREDDGDRRGRGRDDDDDDEDEDDDDHGRGGDDDEDRDDDRGRGGDDDGDDDNDDDGDDDNDDDDDDDDGDDDGNDDDDDGDDD